MPKAAVALPAPHGLTDDLMGRAIYELGKLGTIESGPVGQAIEVFTVPDDDKPDGAPKELPFLSFQANLIPYVGLPNG